MRIRLASSVVLPVVAGLVIYLVVGASAGTRLDRTGDPSVFIVPGDAYTAPGLLPPDTHVFPNSSGYDGQFFFYIAQDPLLTGQIASRDEETSPHLDGIAYRYQRVLLPALAWVISWGDPRLLEWALPFINVLAVLGAGFLLARFLAARGRSPWLSLVFMGSLSVAVGVVFDLADPLAASLFVAGVVWWLDEHPAPAIAALTACLLAREVYVIPVATVVLLELLRGGRHALPWLVPLAVFGAWQGYLRVAFASAVTPAGVERPAIVPLLGAARKIREVLNGDVLGPANWELLFVGLLLLIPFYFLVASAGVLNAIRLSRRLPDREQLLPVVGLASVAIVPFLTVALWGYIPSYARYGAPAAGILVLAFALRADRVAGWLMVGLVALTLTNPVVALLPVHFGPVIKASELAPR